MIFRFQVMVEMSSTFKIGTIKFVGETKFAPGEWVGVALDRPQGTEQHDGGQHVSVSFSFRQTQRYSQGTRVF